MTDRGPADGAANVTTRLAVPSDAAAIARIYNDGIADRVATFETTPRTTADMTMRLAEDPKRYPVFVAEREGQIIAWAGVSAYRPRACYAGVGEFSIYTARDARRTGAGRAALAALIDGAKDRGYWKLLSRIFPENTASRSLCTSLGFREVGTYERHGQLDGVWRDVVIVERLL